jgi:large subunit ribosomal protein L30
VAGTLRITQVRSPNGASPKQRETLRSLGLGRIGKSTERPDKPTVRGQVHAVRHLVEVARTPSSEGDDA